MSNFKVASPDTLIEHLTVEEEKVLGPLLARIEEELVTRRDAVTNGEEVSIVLGDNIPDAVGRRTASLYDEKGWMSVYTPSNKTLTLRRPNNLSDFAQRGWRNATANVKGLAKSIFG